jgi:hypothetical protein
MSITDKLVPGSQVPTRRAATPFFMLFIYFFGGRGGVRKFYTQSLEKIPAANSSTRGFNPGLNLEINKKKK